MDQAEAIQEPVDSGEYSQDSGAENTEAAEEYSNDEEIQGQDGQTEQSEGERDQETDQQEGNRREVEEVEFEGQKYEVPRELKEALLRQSDYTRKTQEVADQRKALEQHQQQFQQAVELQNQNIQGYAQLAALQTQLDQYKDVDWTAYNQSEPQEAQQAFFQYTQLKDATQTLGQQLQQQETQALHQQRDAYTQRLEQGKAELARDIKGWNDELAGKIVDHGKTYGLTDSELSNVVDPRMVKILHDAYLYRQSLQKATKPKEAQAQPVGKVKSGQVKSTVNPDKLSTKEWMKWRQKQLAAKRGR